MTEGVREGGTTSLAALHTHSWWGLHQFPPGFPGWATLQHKWEIMAGFSEWGDGTVAEVDNNAILYRNAGPNGGV